MSTTDEYSPTTFSIDYEFMKRTVSKEKEFKHVGQLKISGFFIVDRLRTFKGRVFPKRPLHKMENCNTCTWQTSRCPMLITGWGINEFKWAKEEVRKYGMCSKYTHDHYRGSLFNYRVKKFNIPVTEDKWYWMDRDRRSGYTPSLPEKKEMYDILEMIDPPKPPVKDTIDYSKVNKDPNIKL